MCLNRFSIFWILYSKFIIFIEKRISNFVGRPTYIIKAVGWEGIRSTQKNIEVMRPEVVSNETKDGDP